jgi:hypothetical protein
MLQIMRSVADHAAYKERNKDCKESPCSISS